MTRSGHINNLHKGYNTYIKLGKLSVLMIKRLSILLAAFTFSVSAQATLIDFTKSTDWASAQGQFSYSNVIDSIGVTISSGSTSTGQYLTFNANDNGGCVGGTAKDVLACNGDGIGIHDDEIHQGGAQEVQVKFDNAVDISNIFLLDLFRKDNGIYGNNEKAVMTINGDVTIFDALTRGNGGFLNTGFSMLNVTEIIFSGFDDTFSDYALAGIDVELSPVPVPGAAILFGSALLGFFGFRRRRIA